jgi:hypothetical protein
MHRAVRRTDQDDDGRHLISVEHLDECHTEGALAVFFCPITLDSKQTAPSVFGEDAFAVLYFHSGRVIHERSSVKMDWLSVFW